MKRFIFLWAALLLCFPASIQAGAAPSVLYGYLGADTVLYTATADGYAPLFVMPRTYFVAVYGEEKDGYLPVGWLDVTGYVRTADAEVVDYTPVNKYPSRTLTAANDLNPVHIRSAPDHQSAQVVGSIPDGKTAVIYGETDGSALIPQVGTKWYYVRYTADNSSVYGYVYAAQVTAEALSDNVIERETPPISSVPEEDDTLGLYAKLGIIAALTVPAVVVMLVIFRPTPKSRKSRKL